MRAAYGKEELFQHIRKEPAKRPHRQIQNIILRCFRESRVELHAVRAVLRVTGAERLPRCLDSFAHLTQIVFVCALRRESGNGGLYDLPRFGKL